MNKNYEQLYHAEEETNWWFVARRDMILRVLKKNNIPYNAEILDIGCAGGPLLCDLRAMGYKNVYGLDLSPKAVELCIQKGLSQTFIMDAQEPDFPQGKFDVIIASDTLEHLENDNLALHNWFKILKENGLVIIFVPAFMFLWSNHDIVNHHYRRYTNKELIHKVKNAGFLVKSKGFWNISLFIPTLIIRLISKIKRSEKENKPLSGDILKLPWVLNQLLINLVKIENIILQKLSLPFGVSTFVIIFKTSIAKKKGL